MAWQSSLMLCSYGFAFVCLFVSNDVRACVRLCGVAAINFFGCRKHSILLLGRHSVVYLYIDENAPQLARASALAFETCGSDSSRRQGFPSLMFCVMARGVRKRGFFFVVCVVVANLFFCLGVRIPL